MTRRRLGISLALVQFLVALGWAVYANQLPLLARQAGIPSQSVVRVLILGPLILIVSDLAFGIVADCIARRLGPVILGVTVASCVAFTLLPIAARQESAGWAAAMVVAWTLGSSALRAPLWALVGRHAAEASWPGLVGMSVLGWGLASALAPAIGTALGALDPRWPFALCSAALVLATAGVVACVRHLDRCLASTPVEARSATAMPAEPAIGSMPGVLLASALAALAFQVHVSINSPALYQRHAAAADIRYLAPVFWVGFSLFLLPATLMIKRWGGLPVMAVGAALAGLAALLAQVASELQMLVNLQFLVGGVWACVLAGAFACALTLGAPRRQGGFTGALFSMLALAALLRMAAVAFDGNTGPRAAASLAWLPAGAWLLAAAIAWVTWRRRLPGR